jgi:hypothetical protein
MDEILTASNALTSIGLLWIVTWCIAVIALTVALFFTCFSRWGRSKPVRICVVLSLLAHVLLAGYAATITIVGAGTAAAEESFEITIGEDAFETPDKPSFAELQPWERLPSAVSELPDQPELMPNSEIAMADPADVDTNIPTRTSAPVEPVGPKQLRSSAVQAIAQEPQPLAQPVPQKQESNSEQLAPAKSVTPFDEVQTAGPRLPDPPTQNAALPNPIVARSSNPDSDDPLIAADRSAPPVQAPASESVADGAPSAIAASADRQLPAIGGASTNKPLTDIASELSELALRTPNNTGALPPIYRLRVAPERQKLSGKLGGSPQSEEAVQLGLRWLASAQSKNGGWNPNRWGAGRAVAVAGRDRQQAGANADMGITGLTLLAFLGAGHTHTSDGPYQSTVARGLQFLIDRQARNGNLSGNASLFAAMYCHGMASFAISEGYAMTGDKRLQPAVQRAISYIVAAQNPTTGGWRYRPGDSGDTSQLGWQLMALKSAELAGITVPRQTKDGIRRYLKSVSRGRYGGLACYRPGQRISRPMTAEALACRQFLGDSPSSSTATEASEYILGEMPGSELQRGQKLNFYYYYYATIALYQRQDDHWKQWNAALQSTLITSQERLGNMAGSWHPDTAWGGYGGRVYSTAMATLSLEVYYRFLPLYADL